MTNERYLRWCARYPDPNTGPHDPVRYFTLALASWYHTSTRASPRQLRYGLAYLKWQASGMAHPERLGPVDRARLAAHPEQVRVNAAATRRLRRRLAALEDGA